MFDWFFGTRRKAVERVPFANEQGAPVYDPAKHPYSSPVVVKPALRSVQSFTCPFCQSTDFAALPSQACIRCNAFMHVACWLENNKRCAASMCTSENPHLNVALPPHLDEVVEITARLAELRRAVDQLQGVVADEQKAQRLLARARSVIAENRETSFQDLFSQAWNLYVMHHHKSQKEFALGIRNFPLSYALFDFRKHNPGPPNREKFFKVLSKIPVEKLERAGRSIREKGLPTPAGVV